ncbi:hypothetical protein BJV78DRAFT_542351 [Lactifluus subvellereus]|nr:hypothetical protein BJV78DRAFT_542351 [Lactifluus subvellereus]
MATRAKARRPAAASVKKSVKGGMAAAVPTEELTHGLASALAGLAISKAKGARNGVAEAHSETPKSTQDNRVSAMRVVNGASQGLTTVMKSGWKAPSTGTTAKKSATPAHEAFGLAASARAALKELRASSPGDVDVERAAVSVAGKLLSLDMYSHALDVLSDMHGRLVALVGPDPVPPVSRHSSQIPPPLRDVIAIISLPLPSSSSVSSDSTLLLVISTYLSHTLIALSHCLSTASPKHSQNEAIVLFSQTLHDSPSLLRWIPLCTQLPAKQSDGLLTRAYTALMSISGKASVPAEAAFRIRNYALMCLLRTSGSMIEPKTFWDQVVKSSSSFARSAGSKDKGEERRLCRVVTSAFSDLLALVEERENRDDFLHGTPFISFCDVWISFSKPTMLLG